MKKSKKKTEKDKKKRALQLEWVFRKAYNEGKGMQYPKYLGVFAFFEQGEINMLSDRFIAASGAYSRGETGNDFTVRAPLFRREFEYAGGETAALTICGLGFYVLYLNGAEITKGKLAPYISNPDDLYYYDSYDLKPYLRQGRNVLGIMLGNGFLNPQVACWDFDKAPFRGAPRLALSFEVDGRVIFEADEQFLWTPSPVTYDDLRYGEHYDARLAIDGWCDPDVAPNGWKKPVSVPAPRGKPRICKADPVRCAKRIRPVAHWRIEQGYLYDFGVNLSGVCRLTVCGEAGQRIRFQHGETLLEGRSLYIKNLTPYEISDKQNWQTDEYVCRGTGKVETYTPHFTYHGFRYVFIEGVNDRQATDELLTAEVWHSEFSEKSELVTGNKTVNLLQEMTVRSDLSNFVHIVTDCPQREKNGWLGDAALSAEQLLYNFGCEASFEEWLNNLRESQRNDGCIPAICPTGGWGYDLYNGPWSCSAFIEILYQLYRFTGRKQVLDENLEAAVRLLRYMIGKKNDDGLFSWGLPDWCETLSAAEDLSSTPLEVSDTLAVIEIFGKFAVLCDIVGRADLAAFCREETEALRERFRKKYLTAGSLISCRTQTAQARAIALGIFDESEKEAAFRALLALIKETGYFKTGVSGARTLFRLLCDNGEQDLALKLMTQSEAPSFRWWIDQGLTTLGESINETYPGSSLRKDGSRTLSLNHHFWGDISGVFYRYILGINVNPDLDDSEHIVIDPLPFAEISRARGVYRRGGKTLTVEIEKQSDGTLRTSVLKNTGFKLTIR